MVLVPSGCGDASSGDRLAVRGRTDWPDVGAVMGSGMFGSSDTDDTGSQDEPTALPAVPGRWTTYSLDLASFGLRRFWPDGDTSPPVEIQCSSAVGDLDDDGRDDDFLFSCFPNTTAVAVCAVEGKLGPCPFQFPADFPGFRDAVIWDLDGDGTNDILTLGLTGDIDDARATLQRLAAHFEGGETDEPMPPLDHAFDIWLGEGDGRFTHSDRSFRAHLGGCYIEGFAILDLTGDGQNEIIARGSDPCGAQGYRRAADGSWFADDALVPPGRHSATAVILAGDWSPDGADRDLLLLSRSGLDHGRADNGTSCWQGRPGRWREVGCDGGLYAYSNMGGALGSLANSVGRLDLVTSDVGRENVYRCAEDKLFDTTGSFTAYESARALGIVPDALSHATDTWRTTWSCTLPDLDLDGDLDVACSNAFEHADDDWAHPFVVWRNDDGVFTRDDADVFRDEDGMRGLVAADLNGDGCTDLLPAPAYGLGFGRAAEHVLVNGTCAPGGASISFVTKANEPAWQAIVRVTYADGRVVAHHLAGTGGLAGHWGADVAIAADATTLDVTWTDGTHERFVAPFPPVLRQG